MNLIEQLDDIIRLLKNRVWQQHGPDALHDIERELRTCTHCGFESDRWAAEGHCPVCGGTFNSGMAAGG